MYCILSTIYQNCECIVYFQLAIRIVQQYHYDLSEFIQFHVQVPKFSQLMIWVRSSWSTCIVRWFNVTSGSKTDSVFITKVLISEPWRWRKYLWGIQFYRSREYCLCVPLSEEGIIAPNGSSAILHPVTNGTLLSLTPHNNSESTSQSLHISLCSHTSTLGYGITRFVIPVVFIINYTRVYIYLSNTTIWW